MEDTAGINQYTNQCLEELKSIFTKNNINGFVKVNLFKEIYMRLKVDSNIDLYSRKNKNNQALYMLLKDKREIDIFMELSKEIIKSKGYSIEPKKYNIIGIIKRNIKKLDKRDQEYFYREMYGQLNLKGINLYSRRNNQPKALIDFIYEDELETLREIFDKLAYKYKLDL